MQTALNSVCSFLKVFMPRKTPLSKLGKEEAQKRVLDSLPLTKVFFKIVDALPHEPAYPQGIANELGIDSRGAIGDSLKILVKAGLIKPDDKTIKRNKRSVQPYSVVWNGVRSLWVEEYAKYLQFEKKEFIALSKDKLVLILFKAYVSSKDAKEKTLREVFTKGYADMVDSFEGHFKGVKMPEPFNAMLVFQTKAKKQLISKSIDSIVDSFEKTIKKRKKK